MPKKKIMVVDDEENLLVLVKNLLDSEGFKTTTAGSGNECLTALNKERPELLVLDVMMPGMNGLEVAKRVRADPKTRNIRMMFLTVMGEKEIDHVALNKVKAIDYITKPFENEELVRRIKWALSK